MTQFYRLAPRIWRRFGFKGGNISMAMKESSNPALQRALARAPQNKKGRVETLPFYPKRGELLLHCFCCFRGGDALLGGFVFILAVEDFPVLVFHRGGAAMGSSKHTNGSNRENTGNQSSE